MRSSESVRYVPEAGDVVWLDFGPASGHEQNGRRPAAVLSPAAYNRTTGLMVCCAMTSHQKDYPFEVLVSDDPTSVVLSDQVHCLDWTARHCDFKEKLPPDVLEQVKMMISCLLDIKMQGIA